MADLITENVSEHLKLVNMCSGAASAVASPADRDSSLHEAFIAQAITGTVRV